MLQFILKPNNGHPAHLIAGVEIHRAGREVVVDPALTTHLHDAKDGPLRLSPAAYEHFRSEFGKALVCEPVGGLGNDGAAARISMLEQQVATIPALEQARDQALRRAADLEAELVATREQLAGAREEIKKLKKKAEPAAG